MMMQPARNGNKEFHSEIHLIKRSDGCLSKRLASLMGKPRTSVLAPKHRPLLSFLITAILVADDELSRHFGLSTVACEQ